MQIHELPDVTAIGSGGYFATDNGSQTTKIDYDALAKAIIEQYAASTLAGTAQSVKAALDGIGELAYAVNYKGMGRIAQNDDLNSYTTPGSYVATSTGITTSLTNCPINNSGFSLHVESVAGGTGQLLIQTIKRTSSNIGEVYLRTYTGSVWGAWEKVPTRAEVDALNSKTRLTMTRTENNLVDATSFNRVAAYKRGNMLWLNGNLVVSEGPASSPVEIGRIAGWSAVISAYQNVPFQGNGAKVIIVEVTSGGVINISSTTGIASGFYRFSFCVPCA